MEKGDKKRNYCSECFKLTNHKVLSVESFRYSDDYHQVNYYSIVKCDGCDNISYRTECIDYEEMNHIEDNEWEPTITINTYPQYLQKHRGLEETYYLPRAIKNVYDEAIQAFSSKCYLLTAIAFRTIIEAICIDKSIKTNQADGDELSAKIDKLVSNGLITKTEAMRLHAVRFTGNDSVHEMVVPKPRQLFIVLGIIEHLLKNLYLIDIEIGGNLDTVIKNFSELKTLLNKHITKLTLGQSLPLGKILGKSSRRLSKKSEELEKELQEKIVAGVYKKLELGEIKPHQDPRKGDVQYYVIKDTTLDIDDWDI